MTQTIYNELRSTFEAGRFEAALKEARSRVENMSNQIQYDFYRQDTHCSPLKSLRRAHDGSKQ